MVAISLAAPLFKRAGVGAASADLGRSVDAVGAASADAHMASADADRASTDALVAAAVRLLLASLVLLPVALRRLRHMPAAHRRAALLGGLLYALHFGSWVASLGLTSVAASVTLVTATPLLLGLVAVFTGRDRPDGRLWLGVGLALVGVLIVAAGAPAGDALLGDALAALGAAAMAAYLLLARRQGPALDVFAFSGIAVAVGGVILLAAVLARDGGPAQLAALTGDTWLWLGLAALIPQLMGHTALTFALREATPTMVGLATVAEPVGATAIAAAWLGEIPDAQTLVGSAIILVAVAASLPRRQRPLGR